MNANPSSLILIGVGGAGSAIVRDIIRSYGPTIRAVAVDTDAKTGEASDLPFLLLGGNRLAGRSTGGQPASARAAFQDDPSLLDATLDHVRTAVVVTGLGGGTGGGATPELLKRLHNLGIVTLLFATRPFSFEGEERKRTASTAEGPLSQNADVSVFLPLDNLVQDQDNMAAAMSQAISTIAAGTTLLWRLLERPGYITLDSERLRNIVSCCGTAQFATATATGANRANDILAALAANPMLSRDTTRQPVRTILLGILGGDDLRLSEIAAISSGISAAFGQDATLELGTVNDEANFSGQLSVVTLLFEKSNSSAYSTGITAKTRTRRAKGNEGALANSHFQNSEKTIWHDEDLDEPTYLRRQLVLDR